MTKPPDPGFTLYSPASGRLPHVALPAILAELKRELDQRGRVYPQRVEKGQMTLEQSLRHTALLAAIVDEFAWSIAWREGRPAGEKPRLTFTWAAKLNELRREIEIRRHVYPKWINAHRITHKEAAHHLTGFECAQAWYWREGPDFGSEFIVEGDWRATYANFRAEQARRDAWAIAHGYDPNTREAWSAEWDRCPRIQQPGEAA